MYLDVHKEMEKKMKDTVEALQNNIMTIRAGRANPAILDRIMVDYYGAPTPINQLANISTPEPRLIVIQPYDESSIQNIEKSILVSDLGLNPNVDGKIIRLSIPQLTEERRKELTKQVKQMAEDSKIFIRNHRREANEEIKTTQKSGELTEDEGKNAENKVQEITDKYVESVDKIMENKEKELLEV